MNASDTTTFQPRITPSPSLPPRRPARRRLPVACWIVGGACVALIGLILGLVGGSASRGSSSDRGPAVEVVGDDPSTGAAAEQPAAGTDSGVELDQAGDAVDAGEPAVELDQAGDTPAVEEPEPGVEVDQTGDTPEVEEPQPPPAEESLPATLMVTPDPVHLKTGVYTGSITVSNVGDEAMQWSALSKPWVSLSDTNGDLGAHGENVITFTIDESELEAGGFAFKIKVWGNGGTEYVDVTGAKPFFEISI